MMKNTKKVLIALSTAFLIFNLLAYRQAYAMLNFTQAGERTEKPDKLTGWKKYAVLLWGVNIPKPVNTSTPINFNLEYETHRFLVSSEIELEAWHIPHPHSQGFVLLFHGYAASKSSILPQAETFHSLGYETFLVDFRGSGGSNQSSTSAGYFEAEDVAAAVDYVQKELGYQDVILYGQSMGGAAALRAVAELDIQPQQIIIEAIFDRMLSTVENRFASMRIPAFPDAQMLTFWGGVQQGYSGFRHNPVDYARKVNIPVLMLHGTDDERVTLEQARNVYAQIQGEKYFEVFSDVGHESYVLVNPGQWRGTIQQFLEQEEGGARIPRLPAFMLNLRPYSCTCQTCMTGFSPSPNNSST